MSASMISVLFPVLEIVAARLAQMDDFPSPGDMLVTSNEPGALPAEERKIEVRRLLKASNTMGEDSAKHSQ